MAKKGTLYLATPIKF